MANAARVYLGLRGDFDRHELTRFIGVEPTSAWNKGERDPKRQLPRCSLWEFSSSEIKGTNVDLYEVTDRLIEALVPHQDRIKEAIARWNLNPTLQIVLWIAMDESVPTPVIGFSREAVKMVSYMGASIDVDTYRS